MKVFIGPADDFNSISNIHVLTLGILTTVYQIKGLQNHSSQSLCYKWDFIFVSIKIASLFTSQLFWSIFYFEKANVNKCLPG